MFSYQKTHFPIILMYHQVCEKPHDKWAVSLKQFSRHLDYLVSHSFDFCDLSKVQEKGSRKRVILTFDDGYLSHYTSVFPLLKHYGVPATIYVCPRGRDGQPPLSSPLICDMHASGLVTFGAHTLTHPNLTQLSEQNIRKEVFGSKDYLEDLVEVPCVHFSYPYGQFDENVTAIVREAGFQTATLAKHKRWRTDAAPLALPRVGLKEKTSFTRFQMELAFGVWAI